MSPGILVGTDFSDGSALAVAEARKLSRTLGVALVVAHVAESTPGAQRGITPGSQDGWLREVQVEPDTLVRRSGVPSVELARLAAELDADMIVLGTHGASGYQPVALGATASRLALLSACPVVLVGPRGRVRGSREVLKKNQRPIGSGGRPSGSSDPAVSGEQS